MTSGNLGSTPITKNKLLIVEGVEEERFLKSYFDFLSVSDIQILPIGGKTKLGDSLKALVIDPSFMSIVEVLGIIRDADTNASSTFQSVCDSLSNANLPVPTKPLETTGIKPTIVVLIMPPGSQSGNLEDLCFQSVKNDPATTCVDAFFSCLNSLPEFPITNEMAKAKVHAFLATRIEPDKRLGEAAESGYWPFSDPAFEPLKSFLLSL